MMPRCAPITTSGARGATAPPTTRSVLLRYALGTAVATIVIVVGGYFVLRSVAIDEAKRDTRTKVLEAGQLVESALADGLLTGDARRRFGAIDDVVLGRVLSGSVVRVKIWSQDGRVLYSDDPGQIGGRYALDDEQRRLLREGGAEVEVSELDRPENARDRGQGELIEAYTRDPDAVGRRPSCSRSTSGSTPSTPVRAGCSASWRRRSSVRSPCSCSSRCRWSGR